MPHSSTKPQLRSLKTRISAAILSLAAIITVSVYAQTPAARPQVEVAAIRRSAPGAGDLGNIHISPGRFETHNMTVRKLMYIAYKVKADRILGGPGWLSSDTYDINATAEDMTGNNFPLMLQTLLEERFGLKLHPEIKEAPVYDLALAKDGPKIQPTKPGTCVPLDLSKDRPAQLPNQQRCSTWLNTRAGYRNGIGISMTDPVGVGFQSLTGQLSLVLNKSVIDKTGLPGLYDVHLEWTPEEVTANQPADAAQPAPTADTPPSIFVAVREQLGLELKPSRGPVTVLVIDSIEKPSEN